MIATVFRRSVSSCALRGDRGSDRAMVKSKVVAFVRSGSREARGTEGRASAERYTVHLRAICPEGAGRSPGATRRKGFKGDGYLNTRARQVLRFVLPRPSWPRRRSAPPARMPTVVAAVLLSSELGPFTRCAAIATVLHRPILELRPSWRAEPLRLEGQRRVLALSKSCSREARGIEGRASAERRHSTASG
jgi:hypothetical protein